ncbi:A-kinase anchor protein 14-like [Littorina saxatilis]|uniref:A-kinase anchor protein 14-like n=1 Tax=Littorina saxatilis TaxID=31220 RepID=UPI0038B5371E
MNPCFFSVIMSTPGKTSFTEAMDVEIVDEVALMNPFKYGVSWEMVAQKLWTSPSNLCKSVRTAKSFRDRVMLLMGKRKSVVAAQLKASGIDEPPRTHLDVGLDEIIMLSDDAIAEMKQKKTKASKVKEQTAEVDLAIRQAAMVGRQNSGEGSDDATPHPPVEHAAIHDRTRPMLPTRPATPETPTGPAAPVTPTGPAAPVAPTGPAAPVTPTGPAAPVAPTGPAAPVAPTGPAAPVAPMTPTGTAKGKPFRGPKRRQVTSDADRLLERLTQRDADQLEVQQKWRKLDLDSRQQQADNQFDLRMREIEFRKEELAERKRVAEVELAERKRVADVEQDLARERLEFERKMREEETRMRQQECANQNNIMMEMLKMLARQK